MTGYPRLERIEFVDDYVVRGHLRDGRVRDLDFGPYLDGPLFGPLTDIDRFRTAYVDAMGTLTWPNGADVAPEAWLLGFPEEQGATASERAG